jgi:hypothetical protein
MKLLVRRRVVEALPFELDRSGDVSERTELAPPVGRADDTEVGVCKFVLCDENWIAVTRLAQPIDSCGLSSPHASAT